MTAGRPRKVSGPWKYSSTPASAVIAAHAGLESLPAATNEGAGRNTASTYAHTARASVAYRSPSIRYQSKLTSPRYPAARALPEGPPVRVTPRERTGPRSAARSSGALARATWCQAFLAGTTVGSAGLAARARVTRADVLAGVVLRAAL